MKNLNFKKVAFGLFLAGYAASNAFALEAVTIHRIEGTAPIISDTQDGTEWKVKVSKTGSPNEVVVGDTITINYYTSDKDGDFEGENTIDTASTVKIMYKRSVNSPWEEVPNKDMITKAKGTVTYTIPNVLANAVALGFTMQAATQFGLPSKGDWIVVSDLSSPQKPGTTDTTPTDLGTEETGPGGEPLPGPSETLPIQPGSGIAMGIFKQGDLSVNYRVSDVALNLGESFETRIWADDNSNNLLDAGEEDLTPNYTSFQWYLTGGNSAANGAAVATDITLTGAVDNVITLPAKNSEATSKWSTIPQAEAGLQGFQLKVTPTGSTKAFLLN